LVHVLNNHAMKMHVGVEELLDVLVSYHIVTSEVLLGGII